MTARTPRRLNGLAGATAGTASVEFALLAPVFILALTSLVDVGNAVEARMRLDSVLRATAQAAMADPGASALQGTADQFADGTGITVTVSFACACEVTDTCTGACGVTVDHWGYRMTATSRYDSFLTAFSVPFSAQLEMMVQ